MQQTKNKRNSAVADADASASAGEKLHTLDAVALQPLIRAYRAMENAEETARAVRYRWEMLVLEIADRLRVDPRAIQINLQNGEVFRGGPAK